MSSKSASKAAAATPLAAFARAKATKGAARATRREGKVPAVIYGDSKEPVLVAIEANLLARYAGKTSFMTHLFELNVDGAKHRVLPRDVQWDPVSDRALHVDFLRVSANTRVRVSVPVVFQDAEKSPGLKRGGTLNIVHHEIEITCSPDHIPENFPVSLDGLNINDAIHLSALKLPDNVTLTTHEKDFTIASIAVPSALRAAETEAAETAEAAAAAPAAGATPAAGGKAAPAAAGGKAAPAAAAAKPAGKK